MCLGLDLLKSQSKVSNDCVCFTIMSLLSFGRNRSQMWQEWLHALQYCNLHTVFFYYRDIELNVIAQNDGDKETLGNLKAHTREALIINVDCYLAYKSMLLRDSLELRAQLFKAWLLKLYWITSGENFNCNLFTIKGEFFTSLRFKEKKFVISNLIGPHFCGKPCFSSK